MAVAIQQPPQIVAGLGVAATASPASTAAAMEILAEGGNAVDAAAAAAWALCVCEPSGSGLGGHTVLLIRNPAGAVVGVEGQSRAPGAASLRTISGEQQQTGFRATTVPSTPATLDFAQRKYGTLPRDRVFRPAIRLAEEGFTVSRLYRRQLSWTLSALRDSPSAAALMLRDGALPRIGERFQQPALARTLHHLAMRGAHDFYFGSTARRIVEDMENNGGLIGWGDLAEAAVALEREPVAMEYRGYRVLSLGSPCGGDRLLAALQAMERLWPDSRGGSDDRWYEAIARSGLAALTGNEPALRLEKCGETTHLCVADSEGYIVTLTQSIQSLFGAKAANAELGFLYNNYLCTCPRRPHPSQLRGRRRPRSNVAPTLVLKDGAPFLAAGAAGSRRIISSVLQTISGVIDRGLSVQDAIDAPRIHALASHRIWIEAPAVTDRLFNTLSREFKEVKVKSANSFKMGCVQAIQFHEGGGATGAADPRRDGATAGGQRP